MGLVNRRKDLTPFAMEEPPVRQHPLLMPLLWGASWVLTARFGMRLERSGMQGLKPPFLVLATHQGFLDYFITPRALFPLRANYVSDMEGFANYGKWLYRHGGCIGKRRYTPDVSVMNNIRYALFRLRQPVVLFPESRHSDAGITAALPQNLGRLVKVLGVPVVILAAHGVYLANPFWDEEHTRKTRLSAKLSLLYTKEQVAQLSPAVMQAEIERQLTYDEYAWQLAEGIRIEEPRRARGLHLPLYQCMHCGAERMESRDTTLHCRACGAQWELQPDGQLRAQDGTLLHIPDWYRWEREQVREEIRQGRYGLNVRVRIEALPNEKGFVPCGEGTLSHDRRGFTLTADGLPDGVRDSFPLHIPARALTSVQTEYNYRGKGPCLVLSTRDCCYYLYSHDSKFLVTKILFATEQLFTDAKRVSS